MNNTNKIIAYAITGCLIAVLFIPLLMPNSLFFPFITSKNFSFRILVEIAFALWLILALRDKSYRPQMTSLMWAIMAFTLIIGVADMFSENPSKSFWSNSERMEGWITILHLAVYTIIATSVLYKEKLWKLFFHVSIGVSVIVSIHALMQIAGTAAIHQGSARVDAAFGNATYLAVYMLFHIWITLFYFFRHKEPLWGKYTYAVITTLQIIVLYFTATRGAILGLIGGAFVACALVAMGGRQYPRVRMGAIIGAVAVALFVGGFIMMKDSPTIKNNKVLGRFSSISLSNYNARFLVWNMALKGFKERPILGWGQESFNYVFNKYYDPKMYAEEQWFDRTHNVVFDWLIAGGLLGLLSYLSLFAVALYYIWKPKDNPFSIVEKSIFSGLLVSYFFHNLFVFDNIMSYIMFFGVLAYLNTASYPGKDHEASVEVSQEENVQFRIVAPLVLVGLVFVLYSVNVKPILANKALIAALRPHEGGIRENYNYFKKVFGYNSFIDSEAREQLSTLAIRASTSNALPEDKQAFFDLTKKELERQLEETPNDTRYLLFMGTFLNKFRMYDEALNYLEKARETSPLKQAILMEIGSTYISMGQPDKALPLFEMALELEPKYEEARIVYAIGAIYSKKYTLADELLVQIGDKKRLLFDDRILRAYAESGAYAKAIAMLQARVVEEPTDPQWHVSLAALYLESAQRVKAVEELRKAIELNPGFKEQGEFYIKEIQAGRNP